MLHQLSPAKGASRPNKRVGRGHGSGHGKTSCKGHKGSKARSGGGKKAGFEGGQMPLQRRVPKKGFYHPRAVNFAVINLRALKNFEAGSQVDPESLVRRGIVKKAGDKIKLLAVGELAVPLQVKVHAVSQEARRKIEAAGGNVEVLV